MLFISIKILKDITEKLCNLKKIIIVALILILIGFRQYLKIFERQISK